LRDRSLQAIGNLGLRLVIKLAQHEDAIFDEPESNQQICFCHEISIRSIWQFSARVGLNDDRKNSMRIRQELYPKSCIVSGRFAHYFPLPLLSQVLLRSNRSLLTLVLQFNIYDRSDLSLAIIIPVQVQFSRSRHFSD
jgi:hypothetical protein